MDRTISTDIPEHDFYYEYYSDVDYKMKVQPTNYIENLNTKTYLQDVKQKVMEHLRSIEHAPGVAMHEVPPDSMIPEFDEDCLNWDERYGGQLEGPGGGAGRRVLRLGSGPGSVTTKDRDGRRETTMIAPLERTRASRRHFNRTSHRLASEQSKRIGVAQRRRRTVVLLLGRLGRTTARFRPRHRPSFVRSAAARLRRRASISLPPRTPAAISATAVIPPAL